MAREFRGQIYELMISMSEKYRWFVRALQTFKYLSLSPKSGECLESYYALMRYLDNLADGDFALPQGFGSVPDFLTRKRVFAAHPSKPADAVDQLILHCFSIAEELGINLQEETDDILASLTFDAERRPESRVCTEAELQEHFYRLDIAGCIQATLKIFGENPSHTDVLHPLGVASRIEYNLKDFRQDTLSGLINISAEDMEKHGLLPSDLHLYKPGVRAWFKSEARRGMELLGLYRGNPSSLKLHPLTKTALFTLFERPAQKCFEEILTL